MPSRSRSRKNYSNADKIAIYFFALQDANFHDEAAILHRYLKRIKYSLAVNKKNDRLQTLGMKLASKFRWSSGLINEVICFLVEYNVDQMKLAEKMIKEVRR